MTPKQIIFFLILIMSTNVIANKVDFNNGCGSGWNNPIVPEKIAAFGFNAELACANHDNCYSQCLNGGDLHGMPVCDDESARQERKKVCDDEFLATLNKKCIENPSIQHAMCKGVSFFYHLAVELGGDGSFEGIEQLFDLLEQEGDMVKIEQIESQLLDLVRQDGYDNNQKISFDVQNALISVKVGVYTIIETQMISNQASELERVDSLHYGNVDITNMILNNERATIETLDIENLDIENIRQQSTFHVTQ